MQEKHRYEAILQDTGHRVDAWLELAERGFNFAEKAKTVFANGDVQTKKKIFAALGSNFTLTDKKLSICWDNSLFPIKNVAKEVQAIYSTFEPLKNGFNQGEIEHLYAQSPRLLRALDDVRTLLWNGNGLVERFSMLAA